MNNEGFEESMSAFAHGRSSTGVLVPADKPKRGARLLSILLRLIVMHMAIAFFFLFAGIAILLLIFLCIAGRILRHRRRSRPFLQTEMERRALSMEEMRCLSCLRYSKSAFVFSDDCSVCLEGFREGEWCRILPGCKHLFHRMCVDRWLKRSRVCPICRGRVIVVESDN